MSEVRVSQEEVTVTHFVDRVVGFRKSGPDFFYSVGSFYMIYFAQYRLLFE